MTAWTRRDALRAFAASAGAATLAACGTDSSDSTSTPPRPIAGPTPAPRLSPADTPATTRGGALWQAPFDDVPRAAGAMFLGPIYPDPDHGMLRIVGVDEQGRTLWSVSTNPSCTGYGQSRSRDTHLAIVLHSDADNRHGRIATRTTASAYDARTGHRVWGPAEVSGPLRGPGLIFGDTVKSVVGGKEGPKTLLSAHDGSVVARSGDGAEPLYEHDGAALLRRDHRLRAVDTATGRTLWTVSDLSGPAGTDHAEFLPNPSSSDGDVVALLWGPAGVRLAALHDLRTGHRLVTFPTADELHTVADPRAGIVVATNSAAAGKTVAVERATGRQRWEHPSSEGTVRLGIAADGVGYGTAGGGSTAIDLRSGSRLDRGPWPVPVAATRGILLAALPKHEGRRPAFAAFRRAG